MLNPLPLNAVPVHFEYSGNANGTPGMIALYGIDGVAVTKTTKQRLALMEIMISVLAATSFTVFCDNDSGVDADAGEIVYQGYLGDNGGFVSGQQAQPRPLSKGTLMILTGTSTTVKVSGWGILLNS